MAAKMTNLNKLRHRCPGNTSKSKDAPPAVPPAAVTPSSSVPSTNVGNKKSTKTASATDTLISHLHEHVEQGRIFDARSVVHSLHGLESKDPTASTKLEPVRNVMDEVISQSEHVESLLHELHSDDDWTLAKQKSGVTVHFRRESDTPIHTVRAATTFHDFSPKDFVRFCSLFVETELMHKWFPGGVMKPANLLSWHSKYSKVIQLRISLGLPMISHRDAIVLGSGYHLPDRNAFLIHTKTILEDTCRFCEIPKPDKGIVRMATDSIFYVEMLKSDVISFKMIGRDDLKFKYMPSLLLNYLSQGHMPFDLMKTIHRKIRNFEGTLWEEKIKERGAYYTEIEDKVYEQLEKWEKVGGEKIESHMHMEDELPIASRKPVNAITGIPQLTAAKPTKKKACTNKERTTDPNVFMVDEDGSEGANRLVVGAVLSALFALALYLMPSSESFPAFVPAILHELLGELQAENLLLAMTITMFAMVVSLIIRMKQQHKEKVVTDQEQSIKAYKSGANKPNTGDAGYDEFVRFVNADSTTEVETGTEKIEPNSSTTVGNGMDDFLEFVNSDAKTNAAPAGPDSNSEPNSPIKHDVATNIGEMTEITSSPKSKGSQGLSPTIQSTPKSQRKRDKVRYKFREIKRAVSMQAVAGKQSK